MLNLADITPEQLSEESAPILAIVSTWGDGAPPPKCEAFFEALESYSGSLSGMQFGVLALGDTEYPLFCECGKLLDAKLEALGAERMVPRTDMDADFMVSYIGWSKKFWKTMAAVYGVNKEAQPA